MNSRPDRDDPSRPDRSIDPDSLGSRETVFNERAAADTRVLISGGGSGIGRATAFLFARLGARVAICGRNPEKLERTRADIARITGKEIFTRSMTIRDPAAVEALLADVHDHFEGLDLLVNNAGGQYPQDAIELSRKGWSAVVDTNLNGTWWMMQEAAKLWRAAGKPGSIVNIVTSVERGLPQVAHSCAARAGVIYLSKTVAVEWAPLRIRVNCIAPGTVETEGFGAYPEEVASRFHLVNPMRMCGDAWDIAQAIAFLGSPAARFINGELLTIDGGQTQWGVSWPAGTPDYFRDMTNA